MPHQQQQGSDQRAERQLAARHQPYAERNAGKQRDHANGPGQVAQQQHPAVEPVGRRHVRGIETFPALAASADSGAAGRPCHHMATRPAARRRCWSSRVTGAASTQATSSTARASAPSAPSAGCSSASTTKQHSAQGASSAGRAARSSSASRRRPIAPASHAARSAPRTGARRPAASDAQGCGRATGRRAAGCARGPHRCTAEPSAAAEAEAASSHSCPDRGTAKSRASSGIACRASSTISRLARPDRMKTAVSARRTCRRICPMYA